MIAKGLFASGVVMDRIEPYDLAKYQYTRKPYLSALYRETGFNEVRNNSI